MKTNENGFTLLELLIAVGILALVIGPFFTQFVTSSEIGERSERIVRAEFVAQKILEEEKRIPLSYKTDDNKPIEKDGFKVRVTYTDESSNVSDSSKQLDLYEKKVDFDYKLKPKVKLDRLDVDFISDSNNEVASAQSLVFDSNLSVILSSTGVENQFELKYQVNSGAIVSVQTFVDVTDEPLIIRLDGVDSLQNSNLANVVIENQTSGLNEKVIELYEFDDENQNFNVSSSNSSTGDVFMYLKLSSEVETSFTNDLNYYWIHIEVLDSTNDVIAELHSSIRKE